MEAALKDELRSLGYIEGENIVISDALQLEDLDFSELRSSYESMVLAATSHTPGLSELVPVAHEG